MRSLAIFAAAVLLAAGSSSGLESDSPHEHLPHHRTRRLIGGRSIFRPRPWMVALIDPKNDAYVWCGGFLIHPQWLVTAASCGYTYDPVGNLMTYTSFKAMVGGVYLPNSRLGSDTQYTNRTVTKVYPHPDFKYNMWISNKMYEPNNVALYRLDAPVNTGGSLMRLNTLPVPALSNNDKASKTVFELFGWGAMYRFSSVDDQGMESINTQYPQQMRQTLLPLMAKPVCEKMLQDDPKHGHGMLYSQFCAGGMNKQGCYDDVGGALFNEGTDRKGDKVVDRPCAAGVFADADDCLIGDNPVPRPGMYTDLSFYVPWIKQTIASVDGEAVSMGVGTCTIALNNSGYKKRYWRNKTKPIDGPEATPLPKL